MCVLYGQLRSALGEMFRTLSRQQESQIEEGHLMVDHVHMLIVILPKYAMSSVVGYIKGKCAIHIARTYGERKRNIVGQHFWARGYFVSTVARDEAMIWEYIRYQENKGFAGRPAQHVELIATIWWRPTGEAALASPFQAALSGSQMKSPGFAGGLLLVMIKYGNGFVLSENPVGGPDWIGRIILGDRRPALVGVP